MTRTIPYSKQIENINNFIRNSWKQYEYYSELLKTKDGEITDLEHEMELATYDNARRKLGALRKVLRERRDAKDYVEILKSITDCLEAHKGLCDDLGKALGQVRKCEHYHKNRRYNARVRNDLSIKTWNSINDKKG